MRRICPCRDGSNRPGTGHDPAPEGYVSAKWIGRTVWAEITLKIERTGGRYGNAHRALVPFPQITAVQRDNWPPAGAPGRRGLRHLLGDAEQVLTLLHLAPDVGRPDTGSRP